MAEVEKLKNILLDMYWKKMKNDTSLSTGRALHMVEVQLLKYFVYAITGNSQIGDYDDEIFDACCDFIDKIHKYDS